MARSKRKLGRRARMVQSGSFAERIRRGSRVYERPGLRPRTLTLETMEKRVLLAVVGPGETYVWDVDGSAGPAPTSAIW